MAEILDNGSSLDALLAGDYIVTDPDSPGLDPATYFLKVTRERTRSGKPLNQQIAFRIDTGEELYRANRSDLTATWTAWAPRGATSTGAGIVAVLDDYFGGTAWRDPTDLSLTNRDADSIDIESSTGNDVQLPSATTTEAGLMSAADKIALDSLGAGGSERLVISYPALEAVGGHRILAVEDGKVRHLDPTDITDADRVVGLSLNAAATDDAVTVLAFGIETHAWSFTPGLAVYADENGTLTQTPPDDLAFSLRVGTALEADALLLHIEQPVTLAA